MNDTTPPAKGPTAAPTTITVHRTVRAKSGETTTSSDLPQVIDVHVFQTNPSYVGVKVPLKYSKEYCSNGIEISILRPCYVGEEEDAGKYLISLIHKMIGPEVPDLVKTVQTLRGM